MSIAIAALLGKELGLPLAKKILSSIKTDKPGTLEKLNALIQGGSSTIAAFQEVFGVDVFNKALSAAKGSSSSSGKWTFEAGQQEYVRIIKKGKGNVLAVTLLRDELNLNLDRVTRLDVQKNNESKNYFLGLYREWKKRYIELIGLSSDSKSTFETVEDLLDGKKKSFADVFKLLQTKGMGVVGALLIINSVLIATSTGVGVITAITTFAFGIPMVQVGAFAVSGLMLIALAKMDFVQSNAESATIAVLYKLLDRQLETQD
jgi:hypothetical protein